MLISFKYRKYRISLGSFFLWVFFNILKFVYIEHKFIYFQGGFFNGSNKRKHIKEIYHTSYHFLYNFESLPTFQWLQDKLEAAVIS